MPYILKTEREKFNDLIKIIVHDLSESGEYDGKLNYVVSSIINGILKERGKNYHELNKMIGVVECVKQELYRRLAAPYEDKKIEENGDVFDT